jgi:alpha-glucosidase
MNPAPPPHNAPRPTDQTNGGGLAGLPIEGYGIAAVQLFQAELPRAAALGCRVSVCVARTTFGQSPPADSAVLAQEPKRRLERELDAEERRRFEHDGQTMRVQVPFPLGTHCYGLGEVAGPLLRNGRNVTLWNTDAWAFGEHSPSLYQSHPYLLLVLPDGRAVGLLAATPERGSVQAFTDGVEFAFEGLPFDFYRIDGPDPAAVTAALSELIGLPAEPPAWALGYHQCRWSYESAAEVRQVVAEFKRRGLPLAAIWFDIDYMDRWRVFTWSKERFPDPAGLLAELRAEGIRTVAILDPGIAIAPGYDVYEQGLAEGHFVTLEDGRPAAGRVWPGLCHFPDFSREETRAWWARRVQELLAKTPLDGLWCDMNEPAVFRTPTKTLTPRAWHRGQGGGHHGRFHNLYGQWMAAATRAGAQAARPKERPFVLTRAGHLGAARVAATWTGDNQARWEDLAWAVTMVLSLGLCGQPFSGPDVGGFFGNPEPELFERWFELGPYLPFFRGHSEKYSCRKEPWSFGETIAASVKANLLLREQLRPRLERLLHQAAQTGLPIAQPLFFAAPQAPELRSIDDQFLLGPDLLVAPVIKRGARQRQVVFPPGRWRALWPEHGAPDQWFEGGPTPYTIPAPLGRAPAFLRADSPGL